MKRGGYVRLTKVGETNPGAYPIGYWTEGQASNDVSIGDVIVLWRHCRVARAEGEVSPVMLDGFMHTSPVPAIDPASGDVTTENSVWRVGPPLIPIPLDTAPEAV